MTVEAIKEEIAHLSEPERRQLFDWLEEPEEQAWERQIASDFSPGGRGAHVVERIDREIDRINAAGNVTSLLEKGCVRAVSNAPRSESRLSSPLAEFWECYDALPQDLQEQADKQYALLRQNPHHPSLRFKETGLYWSVRVSRGYRALARRSGNDLYWCWIGSHDDYERLIKG